MDSILNKPIVLNLNRNWERIGWLTVKQAIIAMTGGLGDSPPALGLAVTINDEGQLAEAIALDWDNWILLPVRDCDLSIETKNGPVRAPTIIVRPSFSKVPLVTPKLTKRAILERDGFRCAYTGERLHASQLNVDHIEPKSRGGKDSWENLVACRKDINTKKGNKTNKEAGLTLLKKPHAPKPVPKSFTIKEIKRPEHVAFIQ